MITLRPYQIAARDTILAHWYAHDPATLARLGLAKPEDIPAEDWHLWALIHMATGTGKTETTFGIIHRLYECGIVTEKDRLLWVVYGKELVFAPGERILDRWYGELPVPGIVMGNRANNSAKFVTASASTISKQKRLKQLLAHGAFSHVFYDEADASAAKGNRQLTEWLKEANPETRFLGMTATIHKRGLKNIWGQEPIYKLPLQKAIYEIHALVPPDPYTCPLDIAIASARKGNGYDDAKLTDLLNHDNVHEAVLKKWLEVGGHKRPSLMFCAGVTQARALALYFSNQGYPSQFIYAGTPKHEREKIQTDLCSGKLKMVANVGVWTRGKDIPPVSFLGIVRPLCSPTPHEQILGRGLRLFEGKTDCIVVYFIPRDGIDIQDMDSLLPYRPKNEREKAEDEAQEKTLRPFTPPDKIALEIDYNKLPLESIDLFGGRQSLTWNLEKGVFTATVAEKISVAIINPVPERAAKGELLKAQKPDEWTEGREKALQDLSTFRAYGINGHVESLGHFDTLQEAKKQSEEWAREHKSDFALPSASWRKRYPTPGQVNFARRLGISVTADMKAGEVAAKITHQLAMEKLKNEFV